MIKQGISIVKYLRITLVALALNFLYIHQAFAEENKTAGEYFEYSVLPLPSSKAPVDYAWRDSKGLIVAQGGNLLLLEDGSDVWQDIGKMPQKESDVLATVSSNGKLYCLDGNKLISIEFVSEKIERTEITKLPFVVKTPSILVSGDHIYVAGCDESEQKIFARFDMNESESWDFLNAEFGKGNLQVNTLVELRSAIYIFTGTESPGQLSAYKYNPKQNNWEFLSTSPFSLDHAKLSACGDAHILLFSENSDTISALYVVNKQWLQFAKIPEPAKDFAITSSYKTFTIISPGAVVRGEAVVPPTKYGYLDHAVVALFFIVMLIMGKVISKRGRTEDDYFRARHRIPWWAAGLSLFASFASAISLMAMPAKAYTENWIYWLGGPIQFAMLPIALFVILPIARRLRVSTAFEYLQLRYNFYIRIVGSVIYSANQILVRMATVMLLPSIALSVICGIPMEMSIIIMGIVTTAYATLGGLEAVIWTDVIQAFVMIFGVLICILWAVFSLNISASETWALLLAEDKLKLADFSLDIAQPVIYIIILTNFINVCGALGDQNYIQRVQCTPNEKVARKAIITQLCVAIPLNALLFGLGTFLYVFYKRNASMLSPAMKADGIFPLFAAQNLPPGLPGVVVAALMAATMSTLAGAINSVANVGVEDYLRHFKRGVTDRQALFCGKAFSLGLGIFGTLLSLVLSKSDLASIWDLAIMLAGIVYSPMIGMYLLGVFTKRANTAGVIGGIILAIALTLFVKNRLTLHPWFFPPISVFTCFIGGYIISILVPLKKRDLTGLTVFSLPEKKGNYECAKKS